MKGKKKLKKILIITCIKNCQKVNLNVHHHLDMDNASHRYSRSHRLNQLPIGVQGHYQEVWTLTDRKSLQVEEEMKCIKRCIKQVNPIAAENVEIM